MSHNIPQISDVQNEEVQNYEQITDKNYYWTVTMETNSKAYRSMACSQLYDRVYISVMSRWTGYYHGSFTAVSGHYSSFY